MFKINKVLLAPPKKFKYLPDYKFKCGIEIHTQLNTKYKLFSNSRNDSFRFMDQPNSLVNNYDLAIPGEQPMFNYEVLKQALKLASYLNFQQINKNSKFDRKHYMYPDNPQGYQITQKFEPLAKHGSLRLTKFLDGIEKEEKLIRLSTLQIEQDTAKTILKDFDDVENGEHSGMLKIDCNRNNVPLIELVTEPDFEDIKEVLTFVHKYQQIVRFLDVCKGDMEEGNLRFDVNINVNDHHIAELKNLPTPSAIESALKYEYNRQVENLKEGNKGSKETRSWDGEKTFLLRDKNEVVDYRFMPDNELKPLKFTDKFLQQVKKEIPFDIDEEILKMRSSPYNVSDKHIKSLLKFDSSDLEKTLKVYNYYQTMANKYLYSLAGSNQNIKTLNNLFVNNILIYLQQEQINMTFKQFESLYSHECVIDLVNIINENELITSPNVLNLLAYVFTSKISNPDWKQLIIENDLQKISMDSLDEDIKNEIFEKVIDELDMSKVVKILKKDINTWTPRANISFNNFVNASIKKGLEITDNKIDPENIRELIQQSLISKRHELVKRFT
ncbi:related to Glutamyl-tRNA(Gln) amidotransferase subunit B, mitochondrial [Hanseniaspora guilliermondii]|uniref:Related to Glutamyl-tRNA(Gln) amidotransferase subunit B, mitochondrial n=1 Tax=Hanseniaspora guilliermondii TaxID=56406 RepID=A0A1L0FHI0_9ASCO|nr:related to Glutamyl-tRNA(Gln) amidotransferase subunit B, mitochondrial [Hanseniaspora guilliermondii]